MKTNFKPKNHTNEHTSSTDLPEQKNLTKDEFEEFVSKSGAKGSFMIFRSKNKNDELGIDQL